MDPENEEIPANEVNTASRFVNLPNILGAGDWGRKQWANERPSIIDAGFNGCGLRSFSWLRKYSAYLKSFGPKAKLFKTKGKELRFAPWNQQGRLSVTSTGLPISVTDSFNPVRFILIEGKTELLPGLDIIRKLDI